MKGPWFAVPAATQLARCKSCRAPIYWIISERGIRTPIDCDVEGGHRPRARIDMGAVGAVAGALPGRGVSHFATCPDAPAWRKQKRPPPPHDPELFS